MFLHCISHKKLENFNIMMRLLMLGTHTLGNVKRLPKNALSFEDTNLDIPRGLVVANNFMQLLLCAFIC